MKKYSRQRPKRSGTIVVLTMFLLIGMVGMLAFAIDLGWIYTTRTELQRSADAAAMAAAWELLDDQHDSQGQIETSITSENARSAAIEFAARNHVDRKPPGLAQDDVTVGHLSYGSGTIVVDPALTPNSVRVRVQRTAAQNGEVALFFARVFGMNTLGQQCDATAAYWSDIKGFRTPSPEKNIPFLPLALDRETWEEMMAGVGTDGFSVDSETGAVTSGPDFIPEINLYPQDTGSAGNRGTVDIGSSNNSTSDLRRQIEEGIGQQDLQYHGGSLELDANGELTLGADPGISAGMESALAAVVGVPKIIPIFDSVSGTGDTAVYTITAFAGVTVVYVNFSGSDKHVLIQPSFIQVDGAIKWDSGNSTSSMIFTPVVLVR